MTVDSTSGRPGTGHQAPPRGLAGFVIAAGVTVLAAIAVVLPWGVRNKYSAVLRWFRDLLMQNSRAVRKWALRKRWEWDSDEG